PYGYRPDGDAPLDDEAQTNTSKASQRSPEPGFTVKQALRDKAFWLAALHQGGISLAMSVALAHQVPYFVNDAGFTETTAAATFTMVVVISGAGRISFGMLMDRYDYRLMLWLVSAAMAASFVYLQLADISSLWHVLPFAAVYGWAFGSAQPMRAVLAGKLFGTKSLGSMIGLMHVGAVATSFTGPILAGVLYDLRGNYSIALWVVAFITLASSLVVLLMRPAARTA
ncbi:MAG: MFS transporter, partial [Dehalococcoidia bacterium]